MALHLLRRRKKGLRNLSLRRLEIVHQLLMIEIDLPPHMLIAVEKGSADVGEDFPPFFHKKIFKAESFAAKVTDHLFYQIGLGTMRDFFHQFRFHLVILFGSQGSSDPGIKIVTSEMDYTEYRFFDRKCDF